MSSVVQREISRKYCPKFGQIAVELGYISRDELQAALTEQAELDIAGKQHRLIGTLLFNRDIMRPDQIDIVLNQTLKQLRQE